MIGEFTMPRDILHQYTSEKSLTMLVCIDAQYSNSGVFIISILIFNSNPIGSFQKLSWKKWQKNVKTANSKENADQ